MSLIWMESPVASPFGDVRTLHWAVGDEEESYEEIHEENLSSLDDAQDQLGSVLWNSNSVVLDHVVGKILSTKARHSKALAGKNIVELGAGVGCLGIALAMGGANVAITDLKELVPLMKKNIELNDGRIDEGAECQAYSLRWGDKIDPKMVQQFQDTGIDAVVMCDALYGNAGAWPALLRCLTDLAALNNGRKDMIVVNYCEQRVERHEDAFLQLLDSDAQKGKWEYREEMLDASSDLKMEVRCTRIKVLSNDGAAPVTTVAGPSPQPVVEKTKKSKKNKAPVNDSASRPAPSSGKKRKSGGDEHNNNDDDDLEIVPQAKPAVENADQLPKKRVKKQMR